MKCNIFRRTFWGALPALLSAVLLQACIFDAEVELPDAAAINALRLSIQLRVPSSSSPGTRTQGENHVLEAGSAAESYINIGAKDYRVMIFNQAGSLVQLFNPALWTIQEKTQEGSEQGEGDEAPGAGQGSPGTPSAGTDKIYTLTGYVGGVTAGDVIQVMVLANLGSFGTGHAGLYDNFRYGQSLSAIYADDINFNFTMYNNTTTEEEITSWRPVMPVDNASAAQAIPMFGIQEIDIPDDPNENGITTVEATIPMLRSIAKIEVIDEIDARAAVEGSGDSEEPGEEVPQVKITGVSLSACNIAGRFIPNVTANESWGAAETQVTVPSLPNGETATTPLVFFNEGTREIDGRTCSVYAAYVPEMDLGDNINERDYPQLTITVTNPEGTGTTESLSMEYVKPLADYTGTTPASLGNILRNHIYTYEVVSAPGESLSLVYGICPWTTEEIDIPTFD